MKNESVAILDIRSKEVTFLLGSKGVNSTFAFRGNQSERYEGYLVEGFIDEDSFRRAVSCAITSVRQNYNGVIDEVYVGVPSPFVSVATSGHTLSFPSKRKISEADVEALYESGLNDLLPQGHCIRRSHMYFSLGDNRKYFSENDLYGMPTTMLKGGLCYYFISDYFHDMVTKLLRDLGIPSVKFIPSTLAQSIYLLPAGKREGYAFLLDIGFLTSSVSVVYGSGIVHEASFDCGVGQILVALMNELEVDFFEAEEILAAANISGGILPKDMAWSLDSCDRRFSVQKINDVIKYTLDILCENIEQFFGKYYRTKTTTSLMVNPIAITGEGIGEIKGAAEHISRRLNRLTKIAAPDLPYYDKPAASSRIALLNMAVEDSSVKPGWFKGLFKKFGGKKK